MVTVVVTENAWCYFLVGVAISVEEYEGMVVLSVYSESNHQVNWIYQKNGGSVANIYRDS